MINATICNWKKETVGNVNLPSEWFEQELNMHLVNEVVRSQRAARRSGTHKAKTRGEVSGGGKKPFRQKGTGNARQGSIRSPLNVAGGKTFGPRPRKYAYALPAKMRQKGLKQALSYLWKQNKIFIMENMQSSSGKTKELALQLKNLGLQKALLVDVEGNALFKRACANLSSFQFLPAKALNVYDVLRYQYLVISKESIVFFKDKQVNKKKESQIVSDGEKNEKVAPMKNQIAKPSSAQDTDSTFSQQMSHQKGLKNPVSHSKKSSLTQERGDVKKSLRTKS